jgi:Fe-S-cluster-containing dehydrogenase component
MDKWNLIIDVAKCENCHNCTIAVKDEFGGNDFPGYSAPQPPQGHEWIKIRRRVRGDAPMVDAAYLPTTCNHCDDAPCIKAAGDGCVYKRPDGIVIIDPRRAKGRKDLVQACPYGAIWWNEELQLPQAWIFDAHLLDQGWKQPRCAQACPTGALQALKVEDAAMREIAGRETLEVLRPELGTRPRVYYRNLHRYDKCFIGASVVGELNGQVEQAATDHFGDFKIDKLPPRSGPYKLEISHRSFAALGLEVTLSESVYLGSLRLTANSVS